MVAAFGSRASRSTASSTAFLATGSALARCLATVAVNASPAQAASFPFTGGLIVAALGWRKCRHLAVIPEVQAQIPLRFEILTLADLERGADKRLATLIRGHATRCRADVRPPVPGFHRHLSEEAHARAPWNK